MILLTDVGYNDLSRTALAAGVFLETWDQERPVRELTVPVTDVLPYESGQFYRRELKCLLALLEAAAPVELEYIVVDGYVETTPGRAGLGRHLYEALEAPRWKKVSKPRTHGFRFPPAIIGVAKTPFQGAEATLLLRGESETPLFITACSVDKKEAATFIASMQGPYRIPTFLKRVDALSRGRN